MPSRATRASAKNTRPPRKKRKSNDATSTNDDGHSLEATTAKRTKKRTNVGKLAALIDMPVDVLFEIFGHLKPHDLLKMARLTRQFRRLLMDKSSKSVWKMILERIPDLPPCPPDMCEPAWVNLVFDSHCHICFTSGVRSVEWALRIRICAKCAKEKTMSVWIDPWSEEEDGLGEDGLKDFSIQNLTLHRPADGEISRMLTSDYDSITQQFRALKSEEDRLAFIRERYKFIADVHKHAKLCNEWASRQLDDRQSELHRIRVERYAAIVEKLTALGYAEDISSIQFPDYLEGHELVKKPQKLTDRVWSNIRRPLIQFMERMRAKRIEREYTQLLQQRRVHAVTIFRSWKNERLPLTGIMPEGPDFCDFLPVKAILEQPTEVTVDGSSFSDILPLIPDLILQWRKKLDKEMTSLLKDGNHPDREIMQDSHNSNESNEFINEIQLATTVYQCTDCVLDDGFAVPLGYYDPDSDAYGAAPLFYPQVLGHSCLTRGPRKVWSIAEPIKQLHEDVVERRNWSADGLRINKRLGLEVRALVLGASLDPETATAEDMDGLNIWFACIFCYACPFQKGKTDYAFTWRGALNHNCVGRGLSFAHPDEFKPMWHMVMLRDHELEYAQHAYNDLVASDGYLSDGGDPFAHKATRHIAWACTHCRDTPGEMEPNSLDLIHLHLDIEHEIESAEIDEDYYKDYATVPFLTQQRIVLDPKSALTQRLTIIFSERVGRKHLMLEG